MSFSGGSYDEIRRWVWNFATSHAKRVDPRIEVDLDTDDDRENVSYGVRLKFGTRTARMIELDFKDVAANRGSLAWCAALAQRIQQLARTELVVVAPTGR